MQHNELLPNQCPIYIEYLHTEHCLHISFETAEQAELALPLFRFSAIGRRDNRINIGPSPSFDNGIFHNSDDYFKEVLFQLVCHNDRQAGEIFKFIQYSVMDNPIKIALQGRVIDFPDLLHPNFCLEKRIVTTNQIKNQCAFAILVLQQNNLLPKELILLIASAMFNVNLNDAYVARIMKINELFGLPQYNVELPYKKIQCEVAYHLSKEKDREGHAQYVVELICLNKEDAETLDKNLSKMETRLVRSLNNNIVIINPLYFEVTDIDGKRINTASCGSNTIFSNEEVKIAIKFRGLVEAATFFSFVDFKERDVVMENESIIFPAKPPHLISHVDKIFQYIDDEIKGELTSFSRNGFGFFLKDWESQQREKVKNQITQCLNTLKSHIMVCAHYGMDFRQSITNFMRIYDHIIYKDVDGDRKQDAIIARLIRELPERFGDKCSIEFKGS